MYIFLLECYNLKSGLYQDLQSNNAPLAQQLIAYDDALKSYDALVSYQTINPEQCQIEELSI